MYSFSYENIAFADEKSELQINQQKKEEALKLLEQLKENTTSPFNINFINRVIDGVNELAVYLLMFVK